MNFEKEPDNLKMIISYIIRAADNSEKIKKII